MYLSSDILISLIVFSEPAERMHQSPRELRGAAGISQSDALLIREWQLHSGNAHLECLHLYNSSILWCFNPLSFF